jgi:hypothetical protein
MMVIIAIDFRADLGYISDGFSEHLFEHYISEHRSL